MFKRILIANRGEIARRITRTCRVMNIGVAVVASEADAGALHVREADEVEIIGSASSGYLDMDSVIAAACKHGAEAIHPGYGFLAQNATFARKVEEAGLTFIGPSSDLIAQMNDLISARRCMADAGVPVLPSSVPLWTNTGGFLPKAEAEAERLGYPLLVKKVGGRSALVESKAGLAAAIDVVRYSAAGNSPILLEKYIANARHIEVQVLIDSIGRGLYLFERESTLHRGYRTILEEAPSPAANMTNETRQKIGELAVRAALAIGYTNAGALEFLLAPDGRFYFLKMNPCLQVEHTLTEMTLGIDIVEHQLRIAASAPFGPRQHELHQVGHAIQFCIYAEDPQTLLPTPGKITRFDIPGVNETHVRLETGIQVGDSISADYDPLIAKLVVWGIDRPRAIERAAGVLRDIQIEGDGLKTNIETHRRILQNSAFCSGQYDTTLIARLND